MIQTFVVIVVSLNRFTIIALLIFFYVSAADELPALDLGLGHGHGMFPYQFSGVAGSAKDGLLVALPDDVVHTRHAIRV